MLTGQPVSRLTSHMLIVGLVNQKGGVGKTSTSERRCRGGPRSGSVPVVDMDPQGRTRLRRWVWAMTTSSWRSTTCWQRRTTGGPGSGDPGGTSGVAGVSLSGAVPVGAGQGRGDSGSSEFRLQRALSHPQLAADFDLVLIDCPRA